MSQQKILSHGRDVVQELVLSEKDVEKEAGGLFVATLDNLEREIVFVKNRLVSQ